MKKEKTKKDSKRRIINWLLISIAIILFCLIASKIYNIYKDNRLSESVLSRELGTLQYDDIDASINELASDGFVLISYVKNKDIKTLETKLKKTIIKNNLQDNFLYYDATDLMLEDDYIKAINKKFSLTKENAIEALPALLYYKDGKHVKTITSTKNKLLTNDEFVKLLYTYEIIKD